MFETVFVIEVNITQRIHIKIGHLSIIIVDPCVFESLPINLFSHFYYNLRWACVIYDLARAPWIIIIAVMMEWFAKFETRADGHGAMCEQAGIYTNKSVSSVLNAINNENFMFQFK